MQTFSSSGGSTGTSDRALTIPSDALIASLQLAWGPYWNPIDLGLSAFQADGLNAGDATRTFQQSLTGNRQRIAINLPPAGSLRASVRSIGGLFPGLSQSYVGALEVGHAVYSPLSDLSSASNAVRADIQQSI